MKKLRIFFIILSLPYLGFLHQLHAQKVSEKDALKVANNWIDIIISSKGSWGNSDDASVSELHDLMYKGEHIGYVCNVSPTGFVVISLYRELIPVKAYSASSNFELDLAEGFEGMLKEVMYDMIMFLKDRLGNLEKTTSGERQKILGKSNLAFWKEVENPSGIVRKISTGIAMNNYQEGDTLIISMWHQRAPYNNYCPPDTCSPYCDNTNSVVGCVATAGSQIMHYWRWPPFEEDNDYQYDWVNMPNKFNPCNFDEDEANAVADLCERVGWAIDMNYGCESGAYMEDMDTAYSEIYRFDESCEFLNRVNYPISSEWFQKIVENCNLNRPVQYCITDHSFVVDGWQEILQYWYQIHLYGGRGNPGYWCSIDSIPGGDTIHEGMIINIFPDRSVGPVLSTYYPKEAGFSYRYFDQDVSGGSSIFFFGQNLQFLPGVTVISLDPTNYIRFDGIPSDITRLYDFKYETFGYISEIKIINSTLKMKNGGSIKFY